VTVPQKGVGGTPLHHRDVAASSPPRSSAPPADRVSYRLQATGYRLPFAILKPAVKP
jgi:hypothetical protein